MMLAEYLPHLYLFSIPLVTSSLPFLPSVSFTTISRPSKTQDHRPCAGGLVRVH